MNKKLLVLAAISLVGLQVQASYFKKTATIVLSSICATNALLNGYIFGSELNQTYATNKKLKNRLKEDKKAWNNEVSKSEQELLNIPHIYAPSCFWHADRRAEMLKSTQEYIDTYKTKRDKCSAELIKPEYSDNCVTRAKSILRTALDGALIKQEDFFRTHTPSWLNMQHDSYVDFQRKREDFFKRNTVIGNVCQTITDANVSGLTWWAVAASLMRGRKNPARAFTFLKNKIWNSNPKKA